MKIKKMILIPMFAVLIAGSGYFASAQTIPIRPDKMVEEIIGILGTLMGGGGSTGSGGGATSQTGGWQANEVDCVYVTGTNETVDGRKITCGSGQQTACHATLCR